MSESINLVFYLVAGAFSLTVIAALLAIPLALVVLLTDGIGGKWMTARLRCWLWLLVAVRLLLPIAPTSPTSLAHVWSLASWTDEPVEAAGGLGARDSMANILAAGREGVVPEMATVAYEWSGAWLGFGATQSPVPAKRPLFGERVWEWDEVLAVTLLGVWLVGLAVVATRAIRASACFARRLRSIKETDDQTTIDIVLRACDELGVRRPRVKRVRDLPTPALFGVWRPTLCLPEESTESLSTEQLRMVVLHEAMHLRRGDGYLAWLLTLVRAVHWFNPIAWLAIRRIENYREQACDDAVRQHTQPHERRDYADLLLRFAAGRPAASLGLLGLWFARPAKTLSARIEAFTADERQRRRMPWPLAWAILAVLAVVGLTDASTPDDAELLAKPELPTFSVGENSAVDVLAARAAKKPWRTETGEPETREYDLTAALAEVDDVPPTMTATDWLLIWAKAGAKEPPKIEAVVGQPNHFAITMGPQQHRSFKTMLAEVVRAGHVGQIVVSTRVMSSEHVERLVGPEWLSAGKVLFSDPEPESPNEWAEQTHQPGSQDFSIAVETASYDSTPYTTLLLDEAQMDKLVPHFSRLDGSSILTAPKITVFSGQPAWVGDLTHTPVVYGVETIRGEITTAHQPKIAVFPEGFRLDVLAFALDDDSVDLRCRVRLSSIDGTTETQLPGPEGVTIQSLRQSRRTVNVNCQLKRGETLLVAPFAGQRDDGKKTHYYAVSAEQIYPREAGAAK